MTQECLETYSIYFACKIGALGPVYYKQLSIGDKCAYITLFKIMLAKALLKQICNINLEEDTCLTEKQVCDIIDKLKLVLDKGRCNCSC